MSYPAIRWYCPLLVLLIHNETYAYQAEIHKVKMDKSAFKQRTILISSLRYNISKYDLPTSNSNFTF